VVVEAWGAAGEFADAGVTSPQFILSIGETIIAARAAVVHVGLQIGLTRELTVAIRVNIARV